MTTLIGLWAIFGHNLIWFIKENPEKFTFGFYEEVIFFGFKLIKEVYQITHIFYVACK